MGARENLLGTLEAAQVAVGGMVGLPAPVARILGTPERVVVAKSFDIFGGFGASSPHRTAEDRTASAPRFSMPMRDAAPRSPGSASPDPAAKLARLVDQAQRIEKSGEQAYSLAKTLGVDKLFS